MNSKKQITLLVVIILVLASVFVFFVNTEESDDNKTTKKYSTENWIANMELNNRDPYGLYLFEQLTIASDLFTELNEYSDYRSFDSLTTLDSSIYMYIGPDLQLTSDEIDQLEESVIHGNSLFISTVYLPTYLFDKWGLTEYVSYYLSDTITTTFKGEKYSMCYVENRDTLASFWNVVPEKLPISADYTGGKINASYNYLKIPHGDGFIHIHLNPVMFVNFQLQQKSAADYLKAILADLDQPKIQWLAFANLENKPLDNEEGYDNQSLLAKIFEYRALRWAFFIAFLGVLLYFLLKSKRERPIIPVKTNMKNGGSSYVDTLAGIYYAKKNPTQLLKLMRSNFFSLVKKHFFIDLQKEVSDKKIKLLSEKSNYPVEKINALLSVLNQKKKSTKEELSNIYYKQRDFYFSTGIWSKETLHNNNNFVRIFRIRSTAYSWLTAGFLMLFFSFILLAKASGWGILLWPIAVTAFYAGSKGLSRPVIAFNRDELHYQPIFGKMVIIPLENIKHVNKENLTMKIIAFGGQEIDISLVQIPREDQQHFKVLSQLIKR